MPKSKSVKIVEVGARDGLQNETNALSVETRVQFINLLTQTGATVIEVGSMVSPKWIPQMAESDQVLQKIDQRNGVSYSVLVPNLQGFSTALNAGAKEIAIFAAASETFSQKNINCSIADSLQRYSEVCQKAADNAVRVRGYVSCVLGCPFEGDISPQAVTDVAQQLLELGCYEVSLGDTIGVGTPTKTQTLLNTVMKKIPIEKIALHCHDTYGQALVNIYAALELGVSVFDSSVAGLGGCPYAPGASGNVSTEDVLYMLHGMNIVTGIDLEKMIAAGKFITNTLNITTRSKVARAQKNG